MKEYSVLECRHLCLLSHEMTPLCLTERSFPLVPLIFQLEAKATCTNHHAYCMYVWVGGAQNAVISLVLCLSWSVVCGVAMRL